MTTFKPHWLAALLMLGGVAFHAPQAFAQAAPEPDEYAVPAPADDDSYDSENTVTDDELIDTPNAVERTVTPDSDDTDSGAMARCSEQFRSFDPATGTYTTYGGEQRLCPYLRLAGGSPAGRTNDVM